MMAMEMTGKMKKEKNQSNRMYNGNDERKRKNARTIEQIVERKQVMPEMNRAIVK